MNDTRTVLYPLTGNLISSVEKRWFTTWRKGAFHCVSIKTALCLSLQTVRPEAGITVVCALRRSWVMEMSHCCESHCQSPQSRHVLVCDMCGSCANISFPCYSWSVSDHSLFEKCIRQRLTNKFFKVWTCSKSWDVLRNQLIPTGNKMCLISLQRHMHECAKRFLIRLLKRGKVVTRFIGLWTQSLLCRETHYS